MRRVTNGRKFRKGDFSDETEGDSAFPFYSVVERVNFMTEPMRTVARSTFEITARRVYN